MPFIFLLFLSLPLWAQEPSPAPSPESVTAATPAPSPANKPADEDIIPLPPQSGNPDAPMVKEGEVQPSAPANAETIPDAAFTDPNAYVPGADIGAGPAPAGPSAADRDRKLKIRYREVRVEVEKDPALLSLMEQSKKAKSPEDERAALREYYRLLFKKMKKADKELTAKCDAMERAYIARLAPTRLEPTIPLNPPPVPQPLDNN